MSLRWHSFSFACYGRLVRENNSLLDKTFIYKYNNIGNITSAKTYDYTTGSVEGLTALSTDSYTYDATNRDRLTYFGDVRVPYDELGCPSGYNGYIASWNRGKLSKLSKGFLPIGIHNYDYSYNALGQRVGISYTYTPPKSSSSSAVSIGTLLGYNKSYAYDQSGRLICESKTSQYYGDLGDSEKTVFLYDEAGMVGFVYTKSGDSNTYYYDRNIRGDVIGIYDTDGNKVGGYVYDAWGNCTITLNTNGIATKNPIRYRGYYYDQDTGLYYLNARYYSPTWRRFISPDSTEYIDPDTPNGLNLYAYCNNDPIELVYKTNVYTVANCDLKFNVLAFFANQKTVGTPKSSFKPLTFSVGLVTSDNPKLSKQIDFSAFYINGHLGFGIGYSKSAGERKGSFGLSFASIGLGIINMTGDVIAFDEDTAIYLGIGAWNANASLGLGFSGTVEIVSLSFGIRFNDYISLDGKVYVGWGISFDFSKGAKIGIGVGIGYEITLNF